MSADIHCFPEYIRLGDQGSWNSLCGEFRLARDYDLFGKMAGVRGRKSLFPPRGLPDDIGDAVVDAAFRFVDDLRDSPEFRIRREEADRYVSEGKSFWFDEAQSAIAELGFHSHSWLNLHEFRSVLKAERQPGMLEIEPEYWSLLAALDEIERRGPYRARVVYWFDN